MNPADCPVPLVAEALAPFIKTRDQVASIRKGLQDHLCEQLENSGQTTSHLNLTSARTLRENTKPSSLSGVRLAYFKALQAHETARANYATLKAELDELKTNSAPTQNGNSVSGTALHHDHLPVVRQREKSRRLKVIDRTVAKIAESGKHSTDLELDEVVRRHLGELPNPPSSQSNSSGGARASGVDAQILGLKKAIIASKRLIDEHKTRQQLDQDSPISGVPPQAEIVGLQKALHELTKWMETQLTVIAEADNGGRASAETTSANGTRDTPPTTSQSPTEDISILYEDYLGARESLIDILQDAPHQSTVSDIGLAEILEPDSTSNEPTAIPKSPAEVLLPHIATLTQTRHEEQALLQSLSFIRQQLTVSEAATESVVRRLSDESHLVLPGASRGHDWTKVTAESTRTTNSYIDSKVRAGLSSADGATTALEAIKQLPRSLDSLADLGKQI